MNTEEKSAKAKSGCCGFDIGMFEMMGACCAGQNGSSACSTMMKGMMERKQSCCESAPEDSGPEEGRP